MEIRPSLLLPAMLKAMTDTVLPAVDPENKLAIEQARLVIGMLRLLATRGPLVARYDRAELRDATLLAKRIRAECRGGSTSGAALAELERARRAGSDNLARVGVDPGEIEQSLIELRAALGSAIMALSEDGDSASRRAVRRAVLDFAKLEVERARAWLLPQGWEGEGAALPPLESLLEINGVVE
jgi:hypothetical protein